jgi:hypothetical protein
MDDEPHWETVYERTHRGHNAVLVHRFSVPGGWVYVHTLMIFHWFRPDDVHISTVFVPDPYRDRA